MTLAELSIRRPVLTIAVSLLATIAGVIGLTQLPVREYPAIDPPTLSVSTFYPGAAAEIVEAQITEPLEAAINTVSGITSLRSQSREGGSQISVEFSLETDLEAAASDVRDQVARVARQLPEDVESPVVNKSDADSQPIFGLAISSNRRSQLELSAYADTLRERLQTVPGIAGVTQPAEKRYAMRLWIDAEKLRAYGLSPLDIRAAVNRENVELPSGRIEGSAVELAVKTLSRIDTPEEFNALAIKRVGDRIVRFSDVGFAELGAQNQRGALKVGEQPIAGLYFRPQAGANQIEIVDELRHRLEQIQREVPDDITVEVAYDNTEYVRRSLLEVSETIIVAFVLVVLVVFAFLREWRTTLIPVIAIPVSIVGAFGVMSAAGFSINTLTLLGIVLSIGLVVDDAIVVLENIYAKIERGKAPVAAAIAGTNEVFTAVVATTIALVVVFLPLLFMAGISGRLFREFGMTISGAVLISAVVALTLTPMLASRLLKTRQGHGALFRLTEPLFAALDRDYGRSLDSFLHRPALAPLLLLASGAVIAGIYVTLPRELAPLEDRGRVWVRATAPEGVSYEYMQRFMDDVAAATAERVPEAHMMMTQVPGAGGNGGAGAVNNGFVRLFLSDQDERGRTQQEIAASLRGLAGEFTAARVNVTQEASMGERRSTSSGIELVLQAPTLELLRDALPAFVARAQESPVFTFVDSDLKFSSPEVRVRIDRERAQALGVSTRDIAQTVQAGMSGQRFGNFVHDGKQYDVIGQLTRDLRSRPDDLGNLGVRTMDGSRMVGLDNLISISESSSPPELLRYNRYTAATVSGTLAPGRSLSEGIAAFQAIADETLDERFTTTLTGSARDFVESSSSLGWVLLLALVLIYLVLAAQFESFIDPLVILLTVPLALAGALIALWYFDQTLNIFSQIGLIMLVGLVAKNGILIVEFANQRLSAGAPTALTAVREAAAARLRPILMTTLATTLGTLPIALALGAGAESRMSMGIAVIGGLVCGGALTLFVIPAIYVLVHRRTSVPRGVPAREHAADLGATTPAAL
jgi:hydrophobe/amphiphile efflux-1 (HAE1) family protein